MPPPLKLNLTGSALIPVSLVALVLFIAMLQQTVATLGARTDLIAAQARQQQAYDQAVNFRNEVESIANDTVALAKDGDPAAKAITESLRNQGVALPQPK